MANEVAERNSVSMASERGERGGALEQAAANREMAEVQAAMVVAKRFPRDPIQAQDRIVQACTRVGLAEQAVYSYARGGQDISGPSIRLAEVMAQGWGNVDFGIRELSRGDGESVMQAYAWDMETNARQTRSFIVPHIRHTRRGSYALEDPRDIYEATANQGARRLRACILGIIPGDVQESALEQCEQTLRAKADVTPEGIQKLVKAFADIGVTKTMIETRIQRRVESIRPAQVVDLKKVYASIRDGMSGPEDWFQAPEDEESGSKSEQLAKKLKKDKEPKGESEAPEPEEKTEPEPPQDQGEAEPEPSEGEGPPAEEAKEEPPAQHTGPPWLDKAVASGLKKRALEVMTDDEWAELLMENGAESEDKIPASAEPDLLKDIRDTKGKSK